MNRRRVLFTAGSMVALAGCLGSDGGPSRTDPVEEYWQALAEDDLESANAVVHDGVGEPAFATPHAGEGTVDVIVGDTEEVPIETGVNMGEPQFGTETALDAFRDDEKLDDVAFARITIRIDAPDEERMFGSIETDGTPTTSSIWSSKTMGPGGSGSYSRRRNRTAGSHYPHVVS